MATTKKPSFQGKYYYYENVNWKEKKVEKEFNDQKKFDSFVKTQKVPNIQMPKFDVISNLKSSLDDLIDQQLGCFFCEPKKKALPTKKLALKKAPVKKTKKVVKKKK